MILIDIGILLIFILFAILGYHKGFLRAALSIIAFFLSLLGSLWFYPQLSKTLESSGQIIPIVMNYSESTDMLGDVESVRAIATSLTPQELDEIITQSNLPYPLGKLLAENVQSSAFAADGIKTLGDYLSLTIANMSINIISFLLIFIVFYIAFSILISLYDYVFKLPVLKLFDSASGVLLGFLQGFLIVFLIFSIVPVVLAFLPFDEILIFIDQSQLGSFYYHSNFIIDLIKGVIA